tara:strand:- start:91 stop:381 length:291 start_codon:yes stop_codon:yes gene_type:complete
MGSFASLSKAGNTAPAFLLRGGFPNFPLNDAGFLSVFLNTGGVNFFNLFPFGALTERKRAGDLAAKNLMLFALALAFMRILFAAPTAAVLRGMGVG